jgi:hypothetical protein
MSRSAHFDLRPDYNASTKEVYRQLALQALQQYENMEVLAYAWQTEHYDSSWPSWIPRWDIHNTHVLPLLLPFLYDASGNEKLGYQFNAASDSLSVRGLRIGHLTETTSTLKYQEMYNQEFGLGESAIEKTLFAAMKLMMQDRWQPSLVREDTAERCQRHSKALFADFSSYLLAQIQGHEKESYITLTYFWCSYCRKYISSYCGEASPTPRTYYNCNICADGDWDICVECYDKGTSCESKSHTLRKLDVPNFYMPVSQLVVNILKVHAAGGQLERFQQSLSQSCRRVTFFKTSLGGHGTGSMALRPGDNIVVVFGSRVPLILRKVNSKYRLISTCYAQSLMDGEAIAMWKNGDLELEWFELQ